MSFVKIEAKRRIDKDNKLMKIDKFIDWSLIKNQIKGLYKYETNGELGTEPYDVLKMFKALLLAQWYSLSDPALEEALKIRLDFLLFTDFEDEVPDETTLCRFRNRLISKGLDKKLFEEVNRQLQAHGLMLEKARGAIIDATIIESSNRPKKVVEIYEDRNEEQNETNNNQNKESVMIESESKDPDAKWLKKGKKNYFGYKSFTVVDADIPFIRNVKVEPANKYEAHIIRDMIDDIKTERLYGDKAYSTEENNQKLEDKKIKNGLMCKAYKGNILSKRDKQRNKIISRTRYKVEQCFGTIKRLFQFSRASYATKAKVEAQFIFKAICYNLLKASNMCLVAE